MLSNGVTDVMSSGNDILVLIEAFYVYCIKEPTNTIYWYKLGYTMAVCVDLDQVTTTWPEFTGVASLRISCIYCSWFLC
jgi:hypothetical protein